MTTTTMEAPAARLPRRLPAPIAATLSALARGVLLAAASMLLWAAVPATWGWVPTTVMSDSMAPQIRTGDVIVAMPLAADDLKVGQVLLVNDPDHADRLRLHRFDSIDESGALVLKGDANPDPDSSHVDPANVVGAGVIRIPYVGLPVVWLRDAQLLPLIAAAATAGVLMLLVKMDPTTPALVRFRTAAGKAVESARSGAGARRRNRRPVVLIASIGTALGLAVTGVGLTSLINVPSSAAFSAASPNPSSSMSAASAYDCLTAAAPDSPFFYYRFSEQTGSAVADTSGNARNGTIQGTATRVPGGCVGGGTPALTVGPSSGYVSTPTSVAGPGTVSVEIWFKTTTTSGGRLIGFGSSQTGTSTNTDRQLYMNNSGQLLFGVSPSGMKNYVITPSSYNNGAWHHAVGILSPSTGLSIYVDGALRVNNGMLTTARSGNGYWRVGADTLTGWTGAPTSLYLNGTIDGAGVYNAALTGTQISAHYAAGH